jgi:two-component system, cell cycle sensor histidine kinase and response regulator CckA
MDSETQSHIFEPFYTTKKIGQGTGLGLSTVYGVVKQSGGAISVTSAPNEGTRFEIFFPECTEQSEPEELPSSATATVKGSETILFVEDQSAIREVASVYLVKLGYNVLSAPDGETAIRLASTHGDSIDLLVTDIVMPNMGGPELAQKLIEQYPNIKLLFMSGYPSGIPEGWENSAVTANFLAKPFSLKALASRVRGVLDLPGAGDNSNRKFPLPSMIP